MLADFFNDGKKAVCQVGREAVIYAVTINVINSDPTGVEGTLLNINITMKFQYQLIILINFCDWTDNNRTVNTNQTLEKDETSSTPKHVGRKCHV